jgi:hypothetical protein
MNIEILLVPVPLIQSTVGVVDSGTTFGVSAGSEQNGRRELDIGKFLLLREVR